MKAVRFESYGDIDVLNVVEVADPFRGPGEVLVRVKAAGIGPGETDDPQRPPSRTLARDVSLWAGQRPRRCRRANRSRRRGLAAGR